MIKSVEKFSVPDTKNAIILMNDICTEERLEARMCEEILRSLNWNITKTLNNANLILVYTCAVYQAREDQVVKLIQNLQKKIRSDQEIIVCGCLPKINKQRLDSVFQGVSFGPRQFDQLKEFLSDTTKQNTIKYNILADKDDWYYWERMVIKGFLGTKAFLKDNFNIDVLRGMGVPQFVPDSSAYYILTGVGCLRECSFCAVKFAKGDTQSKPLDNVVFEFEQGVKLGYRRITLCNDDLGYYGQDVGSDLAILLNRLLEIKGDYEINLREINPQPLTKFLPAMEEILSTGRIKSVILSAQSGSNKVLKSMKRGYTIEEYKHCVRRLRNAYPDLLVRTALMVGFPGEEDNDFQETLRLLDEVKFNMIDVYRYSNRPNTAASKMEDQVEDTVKQKRETILKRRAVRQMVFGR